MTLPRNTVLCHYRYSPLDQLISHALPDFPERQRYYCKSRLATEIQGAMHHSVVQHGDLLLAQQRSEGNAPHATLLATDQQRSVLQTVKTNQPPQPIAYSPYGHRPVESGLLSLLGFNGEQPDPVTGHYLLGNGYRAFNPVLMRFNSPDSLSPFGKGGSNSYAYCVGDPINLYDPNGHFPILSRIQRFFQRSPARSNTAPTIPLTTPLTLSSTTTKKIKLDTPVGVSPGIYKNGPGKSMISNEKIATKTVELNVEQDGTWTEWTQLTPDPEGSYSRIFSSGSGSPSYGSSSFYGGRSPSFPGYRNTGNGQIPTDDWNTVELSYSMKELLSDTGRPQIRHATVPPGHEWIRFNESGKKPIFMEIDSIRKK